MWKNERWVCFSNQSPSNKLLEIVLNDRGMWTSKFQSWWIKFKFTWSYCRLDWPQHIKEHQNRDLGNVARNWNWIFYLVLSDIKIIFLRAFPSGNSILFYFIISKSYFISYTIPFYNTPNISIFYFTMQHIKIIHLHNKIIYFKT